MKTKYFLFFLLVVSLACGRSAQTPSSQPSSGATGENEIVSSGETRHFLLHVPPSYNGSSTPLILDFHGYTSNSSEEEKLTGMSVKADKEGFVVVYPDGLNNAWYTGPGAQGEADLQFVRDLIAHIETNYNIDTKRIYATGISNGGGMANRLGCDLPDLIAAIAPDSGTYNFWENCSPSRPVPVIAFHGLNDNIVPYEGGNERLMEPPIEEWAAAWATRNQCADAPQIDSSIESVTIRTWANCKNNADVILYTLDHHGHSWPGSPVMPRMITSQAINATDMIWDFFKAHSMP